MSGTSRGRVGLVVEPTMFFLERHHHTLIIILTLSVLVAKHDIRHC